MRAASKGGSALVLALLALGGLAAGFAMTAAVEGPAYALVGSMNGEGAAYALRLDPGPVRFQLEGARDGAVTFALYDPDDAFVDVVTLEGRDHADLQAGTAGHYVVMLVDTRDASLEARLPVDGASAVPDEGRLQRLPVIEERRNLAERGDAPLTLTTVTRIDEVPALARLDVVGTVRDLDAVVRSPAGEVMRVEGLSTETEQGVVIDKEGTRRLHPEHLVRGDYEIEARAERLAGRLDLVLQRIDRSVLDALEPQGQAPIAQVSEEHDAPEDTRPIATLALRQPLLVDAREARTLALAAPPDTVATVFVYGANDDLVAIVPLNHARAGPNFDWDGQEDNRTGAARIQRLVLLHEPAAIVLYLAQADGGDRTVELAAPGHDGPVATRALARVERSVVLGAGPITDAPPSAALFLEGGLLDVGLGDWTLAGRQVELTVSGPRGPVLVYSEEVRALDVGLVRDGALFPERFAQGEHEVTLDAQGAGGEMVVTLVTYHR